MANWALEFTRQRLFPNHVDNYIKTWSKGGSFSLQEAPTPERITTWFYIHSWFNLIDLLLQTGFTLAILSHVFHRQHIKRLSRFNKGYLWIPLLRKRIGDYSHPIFSLVHLNVKRIISYGFAVEYLVDAPSQIRKLLSCMVSKSPMWCQ